MEHIEDIENLKELEQVKAAFSKLKVYHKAANDSNEKLVKLNNKLMVENSTLKGQLGSAEHNLAIQKTIVANSLIGSQEKHERDYAEIDKLKEEISDLKTKTKELEAENKKLSDLLNI